MTTRLQFQDMFWAVLFVLPSHRIIFLDHNFKLHAIYTSETKSLDFTASQSTGYSSFFSACMKPMASTRLFGCTQLTQCIRYMVLIEWNIFPSHCELYYAKVLVCMPCTTKAAAATVVLIQHSIVWAYLYCKYFANPNACDSRQLHFMSARLTIDKW